MSHLLIWNGMKKIFCCRNRLYWVFPNPSQKRPTNWGVSWSKCAWWTPLWLLRHVILPWSCAEVLYNSFIEVNEKATKAAAAAIVFVIMADCSQSRFPPEHFVAPASDRTLHLASSSAAATAHYNIKPPTFTPPALSSSLADLRGQTAKPWVASVENNSM